MEGLLGGDREFDGRDCVGNRATALLVEELEGQQVRVPVDAGDTFAVIAHGANRAGHVRAVMVIVHRVHCRVTR